MVVVLNQIANPLLLYEVGLFPIGSTVWIIDPWLMALFGKFVRSISRWILDGVESHWSCASRFYRLAPLFHTLLLDLRYNVSSCLTFQLPCHLHYDGLHPLKLWAKTNRLYFTRQLVLAIRKATNTHSVLLSWRFFPCLHLFQQKSESKTPSSSQWAKKFCGTRRNRSYLWCGVCMEDHQFCWSKSI